MLVSVLIPTRNRLAYLREALESACRQSYSNIEILVSDDGSGDGTREYVTDVSRRDDRVRLLTDNPTPGIFTNMSHLVRAASGDALCLLGDDDRLDESYVERLVAPLVAHSTVVATFCDHRIIDAAGVVLEQASAESSVRWGRAALPEGVVADPLTIVLQRSMCIGFSLFRRELFQDGGFDLECRGAADVDFAIRTAIRGRLFFVASVLADYRVHPGTATASRTGDLGAGTIRALRKHHFSEPRHEALRLSLLRSQLLSYSLERAATDRLEALRSAKDFVSAGGAVFTPRLVAAVFLSFAPRALASATHAILKKAARAANSRSATVESR